MQRIETQVAGVLSGQSTQTGVRTLPTIAHLDTYLSLTERSDAHVYVDRCGGVEVRAEAQWATRDVIELSPQPAA